MNIKARKWMVTGLFRDRDSAERAYAVLQEHGYGKGDLHMVMTDEARARHFDGSETELGSKAAAGAGVGAGIGGTVGAVLAGIAAVGTTLALPGVGVVVAGPLAAALAGAGAGGIAGGLIGAVIGSGIPEERLVDYEQGIREGGILMGVNARNETDRAAIEAKWRDAQGEHVVGTGMGAGAGGLVGGTVGAAAGPLGAAVGVAIGAVAGGMAGKGAAEVVNPKRGDELDEHYFAKGVGAGSGAAIGAAAGAAAGPVGMAAGATIGAVAGGMAGRAAGHVVNPEEEAGYWRAHYTRQAWYTPGYTFSDYGPAYALGYEGRAHYAGDYDQVERELASDWENMKGGSRLSWEQAKAAVRAAWDKVSGR